MLPKDYVAPTDLSALIPTIPLATQDIRAMIERAAVNLDNAMLDAVQYQAQWRDDPPSPGRIEDPNYYAHCCVESLTRALNAAIELRVLIVALDSQS